jgi:tetratricopeptide (TPR) repeat protein
MSYLALLLGDYEHAERYARTLLELSLAPRGFPFIGAEIVLGSVKLRQCDLRGARSLLVAFLERMSESDHMYRDAMSATAACVLGDLELRYGDKAGALAAYRRGWHTVQESPRIMAYQRIAARAQAGLAAAYAATGEGSRARDLLDRASQTARDSESIEHAAAAASMCESYWTVATAWARLGNGARALEALQSAIRTGLRDAGWMERDPEFEVLRDSATFQRLLKDVRRWPGVQFDELEALQVLSEVPSRP